jgi:hypothetical protein
MNSKLVLLIIALCSSAYSQFSNLATTDDGSLVYFVTSLRLNSEASLNLPETPTIYSVDKTGNVTRIVTPPQNFVMPISNGSPQLKRGWESLLLHTGNRLRRGKLVHPESSNNLLFLPIDCWPAYGQPLGGKAQISRGGRYISNYGSWGYFEGPSYSFNALLDLQTGKSTQSQVRPSNFRQTLTGDGSVLGFDLQTGMLALWNTIGSRAIATVETPTRAG